MKPNLLPHQEKVLAEVARHDLTKFPDRFKKLPLSRGYPVPWFVSYIDGKPEFRVADGGKRVQAVNQHLCWVCGQRLGTKLAFVVGPMCAVNRISSDPGMHRECAEWSIHNCPFLTKPHMVRREGGLPVDATTDGLFIERNPGVTLLWVCRDYKTFKTGDGGWLIKMGMPREWVAYREGREATSAELEESIVSGFPILMETARGEGHKAESALREAVIECGVLFKLEKLKHLVEHIRPAH